MAEPAGEPVINVIIPAHNEEAVIGRLLKSLTRAPESAKLRIIVGCNGCTDGTADLARSYGAVVVETPTPSKIAALNLADTAAWPLPRCYVDADVRLTARAVVALAEALGDDSAVLCAAPPLRLDDRGRPWGVRAYHRIWTRLPALGQGYVGSGVYAFSTVGRARFGEFPPIIADDLLARILFRPDERATVATDPFVIEAPWTLRSLVRRRIRIHAGNSELRQLPMAATLAGADERHDPWWTVVRDDLRLVPAAIPYAVVNGVAKIAARRQLSRRGTVAWGRDESTRRSA